MDERSEFSIGKALRQNLPSYARKLPFVARIVPFLSDQHGGKFKVVIGDNIQSLEQKTQSNFDIEMKFLHGELLSKTPTSNWGNDR